MEKHEIYNKVKEEVKLEEVIRSYGIELRPSSGKNYVAICPFHNDKNASLSVKTDSQFYKCVCPVKKQGEDYRNLLYRKIGYEGNEFKICVLDVDKYLGLKNVKKHNDNDVERIVEICKNQYAEAKIAYQTLAVYWRKVSSAIDGQTISYAVEHRSEFE